MKRWLCCSLLIGAMVFGADYQVPPEVPTAPFEVVPGYEACSVYVSGLSAVEEKDFSSKVLYRKAGKEDWKQGLDLVFVIPERNARGSLLGLQEDTEYELKLELKDAGKTRQHTAKFRTKSPKVPIAKTIVLNNKNFNGRLVVENSGTAEGYIRYTAAPGFTLKGKAGNTEVVLVKDVEYVILDGLKVRANGAQHCLNLINAKHVQVLNCDISGHGRIGTHRPDLDGKYFYYSESQKKDRNINYDSGIRLVDITDALIERNYIHDPAGRTNPWFYSHPAGPNAMFIQKCASTCIRYNDCIGSDMNRWNDSIEGGGNGANWGGVYRDAEVKGNYFAIQQDDGIELDGGQMNCRMWGNKAEHHLCGVSTAACMLGPSYIYRNVFTTAGDIFGKSNVALKNNLGNNLVGVGRIFFINNTCNSQMSGLGSMNASGREGIKAVLLNNILSMHKRSAIASPAVLEKNPTFFDANLIYGGDDWKTALLEKATHGERPDLLVAADFRNELAGDLDLKPGTAGCAYSVAVPGVTRANEDIGANNTLDCPLRPLGIHLNKTRLHFDKTHIADTVTVTADNSFSGKWTIAKNFSTNFLSVFPASGTLRPGQKINLAVRADLSKLKFAKNHHAVLLVRAENGLSRPILCNVDNSTDAKLARANRPTTVYAKLAPPEGGKQVLEFKVKKDGWYHLFLFETGGAHAAQVTLGNEPTKRMGPYGYNFEETPSWHHLKNSEGGTSTNKAILVKGGVPYRVTIEVSKNSPKILKAAITKNPEELLFAPTIE